MPDADEPPEIPHETIELLREKGEALEAGARKIGLYLERADLALAEGYNGDHSPALVGHFLIGDLAWSDRVQHPEIEQDNDEFAAIETQLMREKVEELRKRAQGDRTDGQDPAGS